MIFLKNLTNSNKIELSLFFSISSIIHFSHSFIIPQIVDYRCKSCKQSIKFSYNVSLTNKFKKNWEILIFTNYFISKLNW